MIVHVTTATAATQAFFQSLRRTWVKRNALGGGECPIPPWEEMDEDAKALFVRSMQAALVVAGDS